MLWAHQSFATDSNLAVGKKLIFPEKFEGCNNSFDNFKHNLGIDVLNIQ